MFRNDEVFVVFRNIIASIELADNAIHSAHTAKEFGIEPLVAMISYSTGLSGIGVDVDKVKNATYKVKQKEPDLLVDGPRK